MELCCSSLHLDQYAQLFHSKVEHIPKLNHEIHTLVLSRNGVVSDFSFTHPLYIVGLSEDLSHKI